MTPGLGEWREAGWSERDTGSKSKTGDCVVRTYLTLGADASHRGGCRHSVTSGSDGGAFLTMPEGIIHEAGALLDNAHSPFLCERLPMSYLDSQRLCALSVFSILVCAWYSSVISMYLPS
jgi:hypothetical protein